MAVGPSNLRPSQLEYSPKMENEQAKKSRESLKQHPREKANFLSHFFFCWELPIILRGWKTEMTEEHLYKPLKEYESERLGDKLEELWQEELTQKKPSLTRALTKQFGIRYALYSLLFMPMEILFIIFQPYFLTKLLDYYTPNQTHITRQEGYFYAGILAPLVLFRLFGFHCLNMSCRTLGMKVRVACSSLIYRCCLRLTKRSLDKITTGRIVNLLSNDVTRFDQLLPLLYFLVLGPVELVVGVLYINATLGPASVAGVSVILVSLLMQGVLSRVMTKSRIKVATRTDHRIRLMNDVICGIKAIKMYTWEKPYEKLVEIARKLETREIKRANDIRLMSSIFTMYLSKTCIFFCLLAATLVGTTVTPQYIFALSSIYESFKIIVGFFFPSAIIMCSETGASIRRIEELLLYDHGKNLGSYVPKLSPKTKQSTPGVHLKSIYVKWDKSLNFIIEDFSLSARPGQLIGVIGTAGSGKSTLLQVILQEIEVMKGQLDVRGSISYSCQESWIFSSSIKQNILFGESFNVQKYLKVINVCSLERDLTLFPHGDQTLVGERGVMLSEGQKARINLARAIYKDSDIYLLDDPLSAVDAHVGRHIFDECILKYLEDKCVILVTHQVHYLKKATKIYKLESGKLQSCGTYDQVVGSDNMSVETPGDTTPAQTQTTSLQTHDLQSEAKEHRSLGTANTRIYKSYFSAAGGWCFTLIVLLLFILSQFFVSLNHVYITFYLNLIQEGSPADTKLHEFFTTENFLYIYVAITMATLLISHGAAMVFALYCIKASKKLHKNMLHKIIYGTMSFFNHHSSGRILNRFSKDISSIDEVLPMHLMNGITVILTTAAILIIELVINHLMIIPTIILIAITVTFGIIFQPCNRSIKRTEGITRSSVFTHISASLQGLVTIRATNAEKKLIKEFDDHQDLHSSAFYIFTATFASFVFWADVMACAYTVLLIFSFFFVSSGSVSTIGLAVTQSFGLMMMTQYAMKTWGELDAQMTSVERVTEYAALDPELDDGTDSPPESWPTSGDLAFDAVSLKYSETDPVVLKKISFRIKSGEKVGIVGRTGAGKSSIISVLFRLFHFDGSVFVDGIDTKSIRLNALRSKISIIPQEPVLFLGTLRKNIDPFDQFSDSQIWQALEELELKKVISSLESPVSERGSNFSVGQRQLLCLVRAMLRNNKIIVLDEATANVDLETDQLIQSAIRKKFESCTVLTIAHRLNTVMDSDKILVMDSGIAVEFDSPRQLLQNKEGFFYGYVKEHGGEIGSVTN